MVLKVSKSKCINVRNRPSLCYLIFHRTLSVHYPLSAVVRVAVRFQVSTRPRPLSGALKLLSRQTTRMCAATFRHIKTLKYHLRGRRWEMKWTVNLEASRTNKTGTGGTGYDMINYFMLWSNSKSTATKARIHLTLLHFFFYLCSLPISGRVNIGYYLWRKISW